MMLFLAHGRDPLSGHYHTLIVLADDEAGARSIIAHEVAGFRIDDMTMIKDYPGLDARRAVIARIALPDPA
jgi:hypothetical protein